MREQEYNQKCPEEGEGRLYLQVVEGQLFAEEWHHTCHLLQAPLSETAASSNMVPCPDEQGVGAEEQNIDKDHNRHH